MTTEKIAKPTTSGSGSKVARCETCSAAKNRPEPGTGAAYQDTVYGRGMRVMNRCTVCSKEQ